MRKGRVKIKDYLWKWAQKKVCGALHFFNHEIKRNIERVKKETVQKTGRAGARRVVVSYIYSSSDDDEDYWLTHRIYNSFIHQMVPQTRATRTNECFDLPFKD